MQQRQIITVVFNIDDNFVLPLTVAIRSAAENLSPLCSLHAVILEGSVTPEDKAVLENSLEGLAVTVSWQPVRLPASPFTLGSHPGGVAATYFKLFIGDLLPADLTRVIYLDADIVVRGDLLTLWNTELDGHVLGAVADTVWQCERLDRVTLPQAPFSLAGSYFNCGVMVIDLTRWRELQVAERAAHVINGYRKHLWLVDQDLINCVIQGDYKILPPEWNLLDFYGSNYRPYWPMLARGIYTANALEAANQHPAILHYNGVEKPWNGWASAHDPAWFFACYDLTCWPARTGIILSAAPAQPYCGKILPILKTCYRELESGRFHIALLKDLLEYLWKHPGTVLILPRIVLRNAYWMMRAYLIPRWTVMRQTFRERNQKHAAPKERGTNRDLVIPLH